MRAVDPDQGESTRTGDISPVQSPPASAYAYPRYRQWRESNLARDIEADYGRLALRASTRFFLKSVDLLTRAVGDGDILRGVIFLAIVDANTRHLRPADPLAQSFAGTSDRVPDELRRPISVHALALDLALPYETTRRHVNALIGQGLCERVEAGIVVRAEVLERDAMVATHRRNMENLHALFRDLQDGGVSLGS